MWRGRPTPVTSPVGYSGAFVKRKVGLPMVKPREGRTGVTHSLSTAISKSNSARHRNAPAIKNGETARPVSTKGILKNRIRPNPARHHSLLVIPFLLRDIARLQHFSLD